MCIRDRIRIVTPAAPPARICQLQPVPVCIQKKYYTETAILKVLDGVFTAADDKQVTVLIGLDLLAAFDTVDHRLLLDRLRLEFGVTEISLPLRWLQFYLEGRTQFIKMGHHE